MLPTSSPQFGIPSPGNHVGAFPTFAAELDGRHPQNQSLSHRFLSRARDATALRIVAVFLSMKSALPKPVYRAADGQIPHPPISLWRAKHAVHQVAAR